ncbi:hypothetical protein HRW14_34910 [Streptomyces lunaelactis]|uniref:DUF6233 domain-containing protein n=1 Tax=Streptomyces lunaelactis TaxID=1535768 RepID=UPI0015846093|nr:DUF6233 domain-containing protein [Streptomyces lunaelactis]NUK55343.1 hypothetical protein [Streptomyces lunaelactis]
MSDEQSQLQMLYFLRRVQLKQLRQTEHWIQEAERRAAQQVARRPPPPAPDWVLERGIGQGALPVLVHTGACYMQFTRRKALSRDEARQALVDGVPACTHCHPDTALGFLE